MKIYHLIGEPYTDRTKIYAVYDHQGDYYSHSLPSGSSFTSLADSDPTQAFLSQRTRTHPKFTSASSYTGTLPISAVGTMTVWIYIEQYNAGTQFELTFH